MILILTFLAGMVMTILLEVLALEALLAPIRGFLSALFDR